MFRASKNEVADPLLSSGRSEFYFFLPSFMSYYRYITIEQMTELLSFVFYAVEPEVYETYKVSLPSITNGTRIVSQSVKVILGNLRHVFFMHSVSDMVVSAFNLLPNPCREI